MRWCSWHQRHLVPITHLFGIGQNQPVISKHSHGSTHLLPFPVFISPLGHICAHPRFSPVVSAWSHQHLPRCDHAVEGLTARTRPHP